jgi:penicillin amidase
MKADGPVSRLLLALSLLASTQALPAAQAQTAAAAQPAVRVQGLKKGVTVRRDERGIPYIEAADEEDLYFAQGYATAQDRLWQMDLLRRSARGELSEIFGRTTLEEDKQHRTYGFARLAEALEAKASPKARAVLEAYAAGVNAYAASLDEKSLPREFQLLGYKPRPWRPADSIVLGKIFAEDLSTTFQVDLTRAALASLPPERRAELTPDSSPLDVLVVGTDDVKSKATARVKGVGAPRASGESAARTSEKRRGRSQVAAVSDESRAEILSEAARLFEA